MKRANIPGLAFAELDGNGVAHSAYLGLCSANDTAVVNEGTIFEVASLSKPVFAAMVWQQAQQGVIDLNQPLKNYLDFKEVTDPRADSITAMHVLTHTSGLPNWRKQPNEVPLKFTPGSKFGYSGEGYQYLQRVMKHVTGKSLDVLMVTSIFDQFNMRISAYTFNTTEGNFASPHDKKGRAHEKKRTGRNTSAASSLHSTVDNYGHFIVGFARGQAKEHLQHWVTVDEKLQLYWSAGVGVEVNNGDTLLWHWGNNWDMFRSVFVYSMQEQKGYVLFTNSANGHRIMQILNEKVLGRSLNFPKWLGIKQLKG